MVEGPAGLRFSGAPRCLWLARLRTLVILNVFNIGVRVIFRLLGGSLELRV